MVSATCLLPIAACRVPPLDLPVLLLFFSADPRCWTPHGRRAPPCSAWCSTCASRCASYTALRAQRSVHMHALLRARLGLRLPSWVGRVGGQQMRARAPARLPAVCEMPRGVPASTPRRHTPHGSAHGMPLAPPRRLTRTPLATQASIFPWHDVIGILRVLQHKCRNLLALPQAGLPSYTNHSRPVTMCCVCVRQPTCRRRSSTCPPCAPASWPPCCGPAPAWASRRRPRCWGSWWAGSSTAHNTSTTNTNNNTSNIMVAAVATALGGPAWAPRRHRRQHQLGVATPRAGAWARPTRWTWLRRCGRWSSWAWGWAGSSSGRRG